MTSPDFLRHSGWVGPSELNTTIKIVGCGATGSNIAIAAARMGFHSFELWDADKVEPHNLPNQAFTPQDIGVPKVEALARVLKEFNPEIQVITHNEFFTKETELTTLGPMILTTDTMKSRKEIKTVFEDNPLVDYVFETRLGFDYGELHIINNLDTEKVEKWDKTLANDEDIPEGPCNQRICTTLVGLVSSYTVHQLCAMYAARASQEDWVFKRRTMFQMNPLLTTHAF